MTTAHQVTLLSGEVLEGRYDDSYPQRDYGTGPCRRVRFVTNDGRTLVLVGTSMSDRMRVAR